MGPSPKFSSKAKTDELRKRIGNVSLSDDILKGCEVDIPLMSLRDPQHTLLANIFPKLLDAVIARMSKSQRKELFVRLRDIQWLLT